MREASSLSCSERGRCLYFAFRKFEAWDDASDYVKNVLWSELQFKDGLIAEGIKQEMDVIVIKVRALHDVLCVVPGFCFNLELKLRNWGTGSLRVVVDGSASTKVDVEE